jgi:hypothetical protein
MMDEAREIYVACEDVGLRDEVTKDVFKDMLISVK